MSTAGPVGPTTTSGPAAAAGSCAAATAAGATGPAAGSCAAGPDIDHPPDCSRAAGHTAEGRHSSCTAAAAAAPANCRGNLYGSTGRTADYCFATGFDCCLHITGEWMNHTATDVMCV